MSRSNFRWNEIRAIIVQEVNIPGNSSEVRHPKNLVLRSEYCRLIGIIVMARRGEYGSNCIQNLIFQIQSLPF